MEAAAGRLCAAALLDRPPRTTIDALWPEVHGEERVRLPALPEFLELLLARSFLFEVRLVERPPMSYQDREEALRIARRQVWTNVGSDADLRLQNALSQRLIERDGRVALSWEPGIIGVVSWHPRRR